MPNELPLPPELQHLIEKRQGGDRRTGQRRQDDRLECGANGNASEEARENVMAAPEIERRVQGERRKRNRRISDR